MIAIRDGDIKELRRLTTENFEAPLQTIIPWATNRFTDQIIQQCRDTFLDNFWGFWMLGGMSGGGMGFLFDPSVKEDAKLWLSKTLIETKRELSESLPQRWTHSSGPKSTIVERMPNCLWINLTQCQIDTTLEGFISAASTT